MFISSSTIFVLVGFFNPDANCLLNLKVIKKIENGLRKLPGTERFCGFVNRTKPVSKLKYRTDSF